MNLQGVEKPSDIATTAGRGWISITVSKLYFIITGYVVALTLPRLLGTPEAFGLYSATIGVLSILNNVLNAATIQIVSKKVSESVQQASHILHQGLRLQFFIGSILSSTLFFGSGILSKDILLDTRMVPLFRVISIVVFSNALYATLVGSLNGRHLFQKQAALDIAYTTLRTMGILGAAALGFGVLGAVTGLSGAVVILLIIAFIVVGIGKPSQELPYKAWFSFMAPLWIYHLCLNLILMIDLMVLKRTVAVIALQTPSTLSSEAAEIASRYAGFYRAAQTFAFVPYQLLIPVTFIVFPMVSRAVSQKDFQTTRNTIREAMRFSLLTCLAMATPISGAASGIMRLAYPDEYLAGSGALAILAIGMVCFALFVISATILSSAGHPSISAIIAALSLCLVIGGNLTLLHVVGIGELTLKAAATGTSIGTSFAVLTTAICIYKRYGVYIEIKTLIRGGLAGIVGFTTAHIIPNHTGLSSLGALIAGGLSYIATLYLLREIRTADINTAMKIFRRQRAK